MFLQPSRILHCALVCLFGISVHPQEAEDLTSLLREVPARAGENRPLLAVQIGDHLTHDPLPVVKENLPELTSLTEASDPRVRAIALVSLIGLGGRSKPGLPANQRQVDTAGLELLVPYIPRLAPSLNDPDQGIRALCLEDLRALAILRPTPPALLVTLFAALRDAHSTTPQGGAPAGKNIGEQVSMGPEVLGTLLVADATFSRDPATHITEGRDSPEVQAAAIQFLQRPDQTPASLAETIRVLAISQPQNPDVNGYLVPLLNSPDERVQLAMLEHLSSMTLSAEAYRAAREKVTKMTVDSAASAQVRSYAAQLLSCWSNDRHRMCTVPCGPNCVTAH